MNHLQQYRIALNPHKHFSTAPSSRKTPVPQRCVSAGRYDPGSPRREAYAPVVAPSWTALLLQNLDHLNPQNWAARAHLRRCAAAGDMLRVQVEHERYDIPDVVDPAVDEMLVAAGRKSRARA